MRTSRILLTCMVAWLAALPALLAQQQQSRDPHIGYIFPAGGQRGQTFQVTVGGQLLGSTTDAFISGSGVKISVVDVYKPLNGKRFAELQDIIAQARKGPVTSGTAAASPAKPLISGTSAVPASKAASPPKIIATGTSAALALKSPTPARLLTSATSTPSTSPSASPSASPAKPLPAGTPALLAVKPAAPPKPATSGTFTLPPRRAAVLQDAAEILRKAGVPESEIQKFVDRRTREADPKRQPNQQLADTVTLKVEIAPDAPLGPRDVRLVTGPGVSNPLTFCVATYPEQFADATSGKTIDTAKRVTLPVVLNGQILPGAAHHFSFQARRGAHLVISTQARDLIPYLADTVPGWFQPAIALYDAKGNQVAYADHYRFNPDPVISYVVPADGLYLLEIRDSLFRGREDFVYRATVGEIPFITDIFPLGGQVGSSASIQLSGWNLPTSRFTVPWPQTGGVTAIESLDNGLATSGPAFAFDTLPQCTQNQPTNDPRQVQRVIPPVVVNGRIQHPGEIQSFAFSCRAGEKIVAEVYARRLNSPLDSLLKVVDSKNHQLAFNDDCEDKGAGLLTHCADSRVTFTAPADGLYYVELTDAQAQGGPEYAYRLRISDPLPDFALRVSPSGINARPGSTVPVTVYALRRDGFAGDISLAVKGAGLILNGGHILAGQDKVRATLTFPQALESKTVDVEIEGHALINGYDIVRQAVPVDDMIQAFMYHHMVPARELVALVSGTNRPRAVVSLMTPQPLILKIGGTSQMVYSADGHAPFLLAQPQFRLSDPPEGISIQSVSPAPNGTAITFKADPAKLKPGLKGNLIVEAFTERTPPAVNGKTPEKTKWTLGILPAVPFEIAGP